MSNLVPEVGDVRWDEDAVAPFFYLLLNETSKGFDVMRMTRSGAAFEHYQISEMECKEYITNINGGFDRFYTRLCKEVGADK